MAAAAITGLINPNAASGTDTHIICKSPDQIHHDHAPGLFRKTDEPGDQCQIWFCQYNIRCFSGNIGPSRCGKTEISLRQGGSVINAITRKCNFSDLLLFFALTIRALSSGVQEA